MAVLLGNIYPTSLVRRSTLMTPITISEARQLLETGFTSYWGHSNTIQAASDLSAPLLSDPPLFWMKEQNCRP